ncbi:molybdenum cofactor biosynthesis protein MoaE [Bradyrhizobium sp. 195]|uniref:molybdenum cofactor biosynthesis protein MoaE n=1 Tax=Bradyrhizobium sp. 195 TaxID=2782662 RepID=UPI0020009F2D|nr:molybdenum cofactor biosynthesis protein MoaE [Bradyrhizobium sp. 195]UPK26075.1 molybdenum cofactor biosynthesis protein MoaE [Bradyrhizobium sp. 195]
MASPVPCPVTIRIQEDDFDIAREIALLTQSRTDIGAVVSFSGICRADEDSANIAALTLEHYPDMAEEEIRRHVDEAISRWPLNGVTVIHRVGRFMPGENIVLVLTASQHRQAAFLAAEFLMDYLKTSAPFWKKEESEAGTGWVEAQARDDEAAARWTRS